MVHPAHDGGVRYRQATLRHHLHQVPVAELEVRLPLHAQDNDLTVKVAALEQFIQSQEPGHRPAFRLIGSHEYGRRRRLGAQTVCTRARVQAGAIEIVLGDASVRVVKGVDTATLSRVLAAVRGGRA